MISKFSIRNFKCLRDVKIDLDRFTVFVGPNASGKSSILQGIHLLCQAFHFQNGNVENELLQAMSRGAKDPVELLSKVGETWYRYRTRLPTTPAQPQQVHPSPTLESSSTGSDLATEKWQLWRQESGGADPPPRTVLLRLEASTLVVPAPATPDPTLMAPDGTGLHTALASMALNDPDAWQALQANLKRIIPTVRRLRHTMKGPNNSPVLLFDMQGADSLPASQVSEGTLLLLGLLTALHGPSRPDLVLLDDLDRGLHPKAQRELVGLLRGVLDTSADLQIAATTHSPYLLGRMEPDEVRMTHLNEAGSTVCAPLASHPRFQKWKDEMSAGEMWSLFGEQWVVEQEVHS